MSQLVDELVMEHKAILNNINEIKRLGVTSEQGQKKLELAKKSLLAHLKKEDENLYPKMNQEARNNQELQHSLNLFAKDMDKISKAALTFFEKYANGGAGIEFAKDFGMLVGLLSQRITKEETILYKKYNSLACA